MELEDKIRFALSTLRPMAEYTRPYIASVIGVVDGKTGRHVGSGLRGLLDGRRALITAQHVLERAQGDYAGTAVSAGYGAAPYILRGECRFDAVGDLAVYFLPADYPERDDIAFWPETRIETDWSRLVTDYLFLHGFPGVRSYPSQLLAGVVNRSLPYGAMQRLRSEGLPDDVQDESQFALNFDPRDIRVAPGEPADALPDPGGLSGSPVWRIGASGKPTSEWAPERSVLVGIVTQWRQDKELLVATHATRLLNMLGQAR